MNKLVLILFFCFTLLSAQPVYAALFKAQEFVLDNGLHCVVVENHKAPLVQQMMWYKAGSVDEQAGKGGSAHLLEHLMFRGTKSVKDGEFNRLMEKHGVSDNAFTSRDVTAYYQFADVSRLEILMALEADRMTNLDFDDKAFAAEREIVYQERMQRVENNPSSPFYERLSLLLWGDNPYGKPVTGKPWEIKSLERKDVMNFYKKFYNPANAVLVLSGDITVSEARPLIEKYYGNIKSHPVKHQKYPAELSPFDESLTMALSGVNAIKFNLRYLLPKHGELGKEVYALFVLAEYLGGSQTSALYKDLVIKQKIALSLGTSYSFVSRSESVFSFALVPADEADFDGSKMVSVLQKSIAEAVQNLSEKKLEQVKRKLLADLVFVNDNPQNAAEWIGTMLTAGFSLAEVQKYEDNINAVTLERVKAAYNRLVKAPRVSGVLLPLKEDSQNKGDAE